MGAESRADPRHSRLRGVREPGCLSGLCRWPLLTGSPARAYVITQIEAAGYPQGDAAHNYQRLLNAHQMVCSMSRKGDCYDNAVMESFGLHSRLNVPLASTPHELKRISLSLSTWRCGTIGSAATRPWATPAQKLSNRDISNRIPCQLNRCKLTLACGVLC